MSTTFEEAIARARRATTSGRALFREGLVPECHGYMVRALNALVEAWASVAVTAEPLDPAEREQQAFAALEQAKYPDTARLRAALSATRTVTTEPPVSAGPRSFDFDWIWAEVERLTRFTVRHARPKDFRKRVLRRIGVAFALVLVLVIVLVTRFRGHPKALSSGDFSENHLAANAVDGLEGTEWLLPEAAPGWIDLTFPSPRAVHGVRLINAHNVYYADRASREVHVTAFSDREPVASADGAFPKFTQERSVLDLALAASHVSRIRVEVLSFFKRGGGLAEIEVN